MSETETETRFGECADCGCALERPFWDTICFACQEERDGDDETCSVCGEPYVCEDCAR